jgi:predicted dehydrogenase
MKSISPIYPLVPLSPGLGERGRQICVVRRFDPGYTRAKQKIEAGELGRFELFRALSRDTYRPVCLLGEVKYFWIRF